MRGSSQSLLPRPQVALSTPPVGKLSLNLQKSSRVCRFLLHQWLQRSRRNLQLQRRHLFPRELRNPGQQEEDQGNDGCKNKQQSHTRSLRHRFDRLPAMRKRVFYLALNDVRRGMFVSAYPALRGCSRNSVQVGSSKPDTISPGGGQSQCQAFYYEVANLFRRRA